jgi:hypothetical protein
MDSNLKNIIKTILKEQLNESGLVPRVLFHGTNNKFETFNDNNPIFFVDNINVARTYGDYIIKAELTMDNPIELDFGGNSTYHFFDKWYLPSDLAAKIKEISDDLKNRYSLDDELKEYLESLDFNDSYGDLDGIIMKNINDSFDAFSTNKPATNYVVFNKNQIRILK